FESDNWLQNRPQWSLVPPTHPEAPVFLADILHEVHQFALRDLFPPRPTQGSLAAFGTSLWMAFSPLVGSMMKKLPTLPPVNSINMGSAHRTYAELLFYDWRFVY